MSRALDASYIASEIEEAARFAAAALPHASPAHREALKRTAVPVDYMRCAEFVLCFEHMELEPGIKVLDVGSPQWFSIYLAKKRKDVEFNYVNIWEKELEKVRDIPAAMGLSNMEHRREDVRSLGFEDDSFHRALSISAIEHVDPEVGGDLEALAEIKRVLKPGGTLTLTVPLKDKSNVVYRDGPVYDRAGEDRKFYAREYDDEQFNALADSAGFKILKKEYIIEKSGLFALDYWNWGPGSKSFMGPRLMRVVRLMEKIRRKSMQLELARRYLKASEKIEHRVVNVCATLAPEQEK